MVVKGFENEGIQRPQLSTQDLMDAIEELVDTVDINLEHYGHGAFVHPHEMVGCLAGQQIKLSQAADKVIYDNKLSPFKERCLKTLWAVVMATASTNKLIEMQKRSG